MMKSYRCRSRHQVSPQVDLQQERRIAFCQRPSLQFRIASQDYSIHNQRFSGMEETERTGLALAVIAE